MIRDWPFDNDLSTFKRLDAELKESEGKLKTTIEYEDGFGETYSEEEILDVKEVVSSRMELEQPETSDMEDIADALDEISDALA